MRSFQDCCGKCDARLECLDSPVPAIQAIAMVEVTEEMRKYSLQVWDLESQNCFRHAYGNLVSNAREDISGVRGEY